MKQRRETTQTQIENEQVADKIEKIHSESPDKGCRRLNDDLRHDHGIYVNDKRVLRICRARDMFISLVRKYTCARMLNELVKKIEVYHAEKIDGVWEPRLRIHYNCVGEITIPEMLPLPIPDMTVNTRKGVFVNYTPAEIAG